MFEDEIWDEDRWESFLRENDRQIERYMRLLFAFVSNDPPPESADPTARAEWRERLKRYLSDRGVQPFDDDGEDDLFDATGDSATDMTAPDCYPNLAHVDVYDMAQDLADETLVWANTLPGDSKDSSLVQLCDHLMQVPANVAKGHGIGYEQDMIGGNIACAKRALQSANQALGLLPEMEGAQYMTSGGYRRLYERLFELRNQLGLYVQDLRRRFDLGID